jgi:hypothetical protein
LIFAPFAPFVLFAFFVVHFSPGDAPPAAA